MGLGVDIVEIERMRCALERTPHLASRIFSASECDYCNARALPEAHYALRFAAKEAVVKALGTGFTGGIKLTDIEVVLDAHGRPSVALYGRAKEVADELGVTSVQLSLSRTAQSAVASVAAITPDMKPKAPAKPDPKEELMRAFKEARALLNADDVAGAVEQMKLELDDDSLVASDTASE